MRIIAGSAKGRRLKPIGTIGIRPTSDRVREALFSILTSRFDLAGTRLLDLFAGSGALGVEALSRGAEHVVFVEKSRRAARVLAANLEICEFTSRSRLLVLPVVRALAELRRAERSFDGVFLDPPYGRGLADATLECLAEAAQLSEAGWVIVEAHVDDVLHESYGRLRLTTKRRYGKTVLALFMNEPVKGRASAS